MTEQYAHSVSECTSESSDVDVIVVGAGFSGLYMLHSLRQRGLSVRVFEAAADVGGTWYWNRYPGARCDSESWYYSYSFSPELEQEWSWSCRFPDQAEILSYLEHVADRFDLRTDITFDTRVTAAQWHEGHGHWTVTTDGGERVTAAKIVLAVGCLSAAQVPDIKGLENFEGDWYHTGDWPHERVDFTGKRVGVIGTGSSGIQIIPLIAEDAAHLTVFQRTPSYAIPARNAPLTPERQREIKADIARIRETAKNSIFGFPFTQRRESAITADPQERQEFYESAWERGGFELLYAGYYDTTLDEEANDLLAQFVRDKIAEVVDDPDTASILTPWDYPIGTKRLALHTHYFETFNNDNVELVDVRRDPIETITSSGIETSASEHPLDVIVFATGYDALTGSLTRIDIRGRNGISLADTWAEGPQSYLGIGVNGFPNMFIMTGPGSPAGMGNMPVTIEQQVEWISECIDDLRRAGADRIEPSLEAQKAWGEHVNTLADRTLLPRADSWYLGANVPGKPRVFMPYIGGLGRYRARCQEVRERQYEGFLLS